MAFRALVFLGYICVYIYTYISIYIYKRQGNSASGLRWWDLGHLPGKRSCPATIPQKLGMSYLALVYTHWGVELIGVVFRGLEDEC